MRKTILKPLLVLALLLATSACVPSFVVTATPSGAKTAVGQTPAGLTTTPQPGIPITGGESPTATMVTSVPTTVIVTASPSGVPTLLLSPAPGLTSTPVVSTGAAQVSVSVGTNCRSGPGVKYTRVGGLPAGQAAEVVGQYPAANYWIIKNPNRPGETCWLWGQFASVTGNVSTLPVVTPPVTPTPTAAFDVAYKGTIVNCATTGWWTNMDLENTGGLTFKSMALTVQDTDGNNINRILTSDGFTNNTGCSQATTQNTLAPGQTVTVSTPVLGYDPTGHRLRATIDLCTNARQTGICVTQIVTLKP